MGVPSPGPVPGREGRAEDGSVVAAVAFAGMGTITAGSRAAALAMCSNLRNGRKEPAQQKFLIMYLTLIFSV